MLLALLAVPSAARAQCYDQLPAAVIDCNGFPGCYDITLGWSRNSAGGFVDYYRITNNQTSQTVQVDGLSYDFTNLQPGTNYTFTIVPHNCAGDGPAATFASSTATGCPAAPTVVSVSQGTNPPTPPYVTLGYTINQSGATPAGFHFYSRFPNDPSSEAATGLEDHSSGAGVHTVNIYSDYYQREFAAVSYIVVNGHTYESPKSNWFPGWPNGTPIPPVASGNWIAPIGNSICYGSPYRFKWGVANNARQWNLRVATDLNFTNVVYTASNIATIDVQTNQWYQDVSGLLPKQLYYWQLQPISGTGSTGSWAYPTSFTMGALAITSPTGSVTWNIGSQQTVQWSLVCGSGDKVEIFPTPTIVGDHLTGTSVVLATSATGGQLTFTVPCMVSTQARIQITRTLAGGITEYAYSASPITINFAAGNGNAVKSGPGAIVGQVHSASNGDGSTYVCWSDNSNGSNADVFVARLDATGKPVTGWPIDVTPSITGNQTEPQILADGSGGVFVSWTDERNGSNNQDVYAIRLNSAGATISGWGAAAPTYGGIAIANYNYLQHHPSMARASDGALLIAWADARDVSHHFIYAQKLTTAGAAVWTAGGVPVSETGTEYSASIVSDGQGGAYLSYVNGYSYEGYLQHLLAATGAREWSYWSTIVTNFTSNTSANTPPLIDLGGGAVMMAYLSLTTNPNTSDLHAYSYDPATQTPWDVVVCNATGDQTAPVMVSDGSGGAIIAWRDTRSGSLAEYASRILHNGTLAAGWPANGVQVASAIDVRYDDDLPAVAPDGSGGAAFAWRTWPGDIKACVVNYAACVGATTTVCGDGLEQGDPTVALSGVGSSVIAWRDARCSGTDTGVFASGYGIPNVSSGVNVSVHCFGAVSVDFSGSTDAVLGAPNYYDVRMSSSPITEDNFAMTSQLYYGPSNSTIDLTVSCTYRTYFACKARYGTCYWSHMGQSTWVIGYCNPNCFDDFSAKQVLPTKLDVSPQPNPAVNSVRLALAIPGSHNGQPLQLAVYDLRGRLVRNLEGGTAAAGKHEIVWDATETDGRRAAPGLYFVKLRCGDAIVRREVILVR